MEKGMTFCCTPNTGKLSDQTGETLSPPTQPWTYKEGQFWNFVDDELANLRKLVQDGNSSTSDICRCHTFLREGVFYYIISIANLINGRF
ncbi:hypothetical protein PILCRDRAFT_817806 [Piloderma croceum F 1598]|uniref:Uncharacterized protein n=1 Tax=Piloderma croceum (strain F 1598) TaxID=765440 RepID=A0A0C3BF82_PILCF|nr:hypothetical protein PILCRDRAFT_817806 [Piloderma croceum F 1598]